ncbi:MAG: SnoaL-like domain-containing protein [Pseudomonadota bacterium]
MFDEKLIQIGNDLVAYNNADQSRKALDELYDENAVSVEAAAAPDTPGREVKGLANIHGKHDWWDSAHDVHSSKAEGPFFHGDDRIGVIFELDATTRETGERFQMRELAVYHVQNGKIVREEFYYPAQ